MSRKATHIGTCQICGHVQRLPAGRLSKHGYTVQWNMFNGVCPGADYLPFEQDISLIQGAIADARVTARRIREDAQALRTDSDPVKTWVHEHTSTASYRSIYVWRELPSAEITGNSCSAEWIGKDGKKQSRSIYREYNQTAHNALNVERAKYLESQAKRYDEYAKWQESRIKDWKPTELKPIKDETAKEIKVGSKVKVLGSVVTVTKIDYRVARAVGPSLNGQVIPHVFWMGDDGKERAYPKRFARLVCEE